MIEFEPVLWLPHHSNQHVARLIARHIRDDGTVTNLGCNVVVDDEVYENVHSRTSIEDNLRAEAAHYVRRKGLNDASAPHNRQA